MGHCFEKETAENVFYTDFDVDDVFANALFPLKMKNKYGMALGGVDDGMSTRPENGFIAFRRGVGEDFLKTILIPTTIKSLKKGKGDGFIILHNALLDFGESKGVLRFADHISIPMLHERGRVIPSLE